MSERISDERLFPERLHLRGPCGLGRALDEIAARQHTTRSEVIRRCLFAELEHNGIGIVAQLIEERVS